MSKYSRFFDKNKELKEVEGKDISVITDYLKLMEYPKNSYGWQEPQELIYYPKVKELKEKVKEKEVEKVAYKKQKIPKSVRTHVWELYIGPHINEHRCLCCKKTLIKITNFDVGHVVAESNGGTLEINNLRPICSVCNHAMQSTNMIDFVKKFGYYI
jgi:5-methylcytosine-specific restriction endonuclease McrA